jgi:hypothetical protein
MLLQYNISDRHTLLNNDFLDLAFKTKNIDNHSYDTYKLSCLIFLDKNTHFVLSLNK